MVDKRILNFLIIIILTTITFWWTFFIFHLPFDWNIVSIVIILRMISSRILFNDYSLSWSSATQRTFLYKTLVVAAPFVVTIFLYFKDVRLALLFTEASFYLVSVNFLMYLYYFYINRNKVIKLKSLVIYGAGKAGMKLEDEFRSTEYSVKFFIDDNPVRQGRSMDNIKIISKIQFKEIM